MSQSQPWLGEATSDRAGERAVAEAASDLLVVSNRQPYRHEYDGDDIDVDRPTGGLTAGLDPVMRSVEGTWIAWGDGDADRAVVDDANRVRVPRDGGDGQFVLRRVWLDDERVEGFYYGFSNRVLWPLCHSALTEIEGRAGDWEHYRAANEQFADATAEALAGRAGASGGARTAGTGAAASGAATNGAAVNGAAANGAAANGTVANGTTATANGGAASGAGARNGGDLAGIADGDAVVWFQDYHLALAPRMLRERGSDAVVAHTWHVPWPGWDVFRGCPRGGEILQGLLAADLVTFHVQRHCENFLECVAAAVPGARIDWQRGTVTVGDDRTAVRAFPMGVAAEEIHRRARSDAADSFWRGFADEHDLNEGTQVAVGVDRLDYTKGIPERIAALEHLWETRPRWREALTCVQVGTESRSEIPAYADYQERVSDSVERVNDRFGTESWTPIVYTTEYLADEAIDALYRHADVGLVTPIRDGMNLVAQEYVAAQDEDGGALVLSEGAGAHDEIGEWALSISPHDVGDTAATIETALTLAPAERRARTTALQRYVAAGVDSWVASVFDAIASLRQHRPGDQRSARA